MSDQRFKNKKKNKKYRKHDWTFRNQYRVMLEFDWDNIN